MQKPDQRQTGVIAPRRLGLFQAGTKLIRIGQAGMHAGDGPNHPASAASVSYHRKESDREQHRRDKRGENDGDHDASLATATKIARLSLCHVRSALRERFSGSPQCAHAIFRLGGNHDASQFGLPLPG